MHTRRTEFARRRIIISTWLCAVLLAGAAAAGADGGIAHIVIIWLHEPGNAEHRNRVLQASRTLLDIPGVTGLESGQVVTSGRAIVDDSFDVGLVIHLADQAALDAYPAHPLHVRLVNETLQPLVRRIQVYDLRQ